MGGISANRARARTQIYPHTTLLSAQIEERLYRGCHQMPRAEQTEDFEPGDGRASSRPRRGRRMGSAPPALPCLDRRAAPAREAAASCPVGRRAPSPACAHGYGPASASCSGRPRPARAAASRRPATLSRGGSRRRRREKESDAEKGRNPCLCLCRQGTLAGEAPRAVRTHPLWGLGAVKCRSLACEQL